MPLEVTNHRHTVRQRGGGILATRDHQDLGSSLCTLGGVGRAHFFHSKHQDPDETRHARDDQETKDISWPNYHSGSNGDYQLVMPVEPVHGYECSLHATIDGNELGLLRGPHFVLPALESRETIR